MIAVMSITMVRNKASDKFNITGEVRNGLGMWTTIDLPYFPVIGKTNYFGNRNPIALRDDGGGGGRRGRL